MEKLRQLLHRGRNGNALLFCGAGLTADCLNFDDESALGVTGHLLDILNDDLRSNGKESGFKDVKNASKRYSRDIGRHKLMVRLKERFKLSNVSASIVDIAKYPWTSIYTTNYDNGLELAFHRASKKSTTINNLDNANDEYPGTHIVHLHGFADAWSDENFDRSCILDADSYRSLQGVKDWLDRLRFDIERASVVIFIGFRAADFHLEQVFLTQPALKKRHFLSIAHLRLQIQMSEHLKKISESLYILGANNSRR